MKRLIITTLLSGLAVATAAPAAAAPFITIDTGSGTFGNPNLTCTAPATSCSFSDTLTFTTPVGFNLASATISSSMVGTDASTNVDFSSVTLNGIPFNSVITGAVEFRNLLNQALVAGANNTLIVSGMTGTNGSYGGSLTFAATPAVPEAATWAMMIAGFGAVGTAMRRRSRVNAAVNFA